MYNLAKQSLKSIACSLVVLATSCSPTPNPHFKVGKPYVIDGQQYVPGIDPRYSEIGVASWYGNGDGFNNELTANGELFDKDLMTAAHKTLPLPSVVKVTNLENGNAVKLRVNDRGPFVKGRIIDVSEEASKRLGFRDKGSTKVLVELDKAASLSVAKTVKIKPADQEILFASYSGPYVSKNKLATKDLIQNNVKEIKKYYDTADIIEPAKVAKVNEPESMSSGEPKSIQYAKIKKAQFQNNATAKPKSQQITSTASILSPSSGINPANDGKFYIQIASFSDLKNASDLTSKVSNIAETAIEERDVNGKTFYRVKVGSFDNRSDASGKLNKLKSEGYKDAFIIAEK